MIIIYLLNYLKNATQYVFLDVIILYNGQDSIVPFIKLNIKEKKDCKCAPQKKAPIKCYSKYIKQAKPPVKYTKVFAYVPFGGVEGNRTPVQK